jgi:hypothetical protein
MDNDIVLGADMNTRVSDKLKTKGFNPNQTKT